MRKIACIAHAGVVVFSASIASVWAEEDNRAWDEFNQFIQSIKTLQVDFVQTVDNHSSNHQLLDDQSKAAPARISPIPPQRGRLLIDKPNYLRWEVFEPSQQVIIVNAQEKTTWIYDPDLQQAIYQPLNQQQTITPAELLLGRKGLEKNFLLDTFVESQDDGKPSIWLNATPKSTHSAFQWIRLKIEEGQLSAIRVLDAMDRQITITFLEPQHNIFIDPKQFQFTPPVDVDVIDQVHQLDWSNPSQW